MNKTARITAIQFTTYRTFRFNPEKEGDTFECDRASDID